MKSGQARDTEAVQDQDRNQGHGLETTSLTADVKSLLCSSLWLEFTKLNRRFIASVHWLWLFAAFLA